MDTKLIGVKYPTSATVAMGKKMLHEVQTVADKNVLKSVIHNLLFADKFNYVLVNFEGIYYVCEKDSDTTFCKRKIEYHPLMEKLV